ncbi:hypothetical protein L083_4064 [Actinoplanes sp. N902-109]|nr:hypothetical protein L083_4064 [Actinoplanes sp. N902-109]
MVLVAAVAGLGGCGAGDAAEPAAPADNTAAICARWRQAEAPFLTNTAPEAEAYNRTIADAYEGKPVTGATGIRRKYWAAWADAVRPLAAEATGAGLRDALTAQVSTLDEHAAAGDAALSDVSSAVAQMCLPASGTAVNP